MGAAALSLKLLLENSVYENNGIQAIEIASAGNLSSVFDTPGTVPFAGLPYHVYSGFTIKTEVTFESGVTCRFEKGKDMTITTEGAIIANAAGSDHITFEGMLAAQGAWVGMTIHSPSPINHMDGVIVRHGGDVGGRGANIYMYGSTPGSQLTITNSNISDSETWGIKTASGNANLTQSGNTFNNNKLGDILQQ